MAKNGLTPAAAQRMEEVRAEAFINLALRQFTDPPFVADFMKTLGATDTRAKLSKQIVPDSEARTGFALRASHEGPYLSERNAGPKDAPLEVEFTTPSGGKRQFRLIHSSYDSTTGFKGIAFREVGEDRIKIIFPGSDYTRVDNLAIINMVLGDVLNYQVKKEKEFTGKVMQHVDPRSTQIDVVGMSLGAQSSVMALMQLMETYGAQDANLMLVEGFLPGLAMKHGCERIAARREESGTRTTPLAEAQRISGHISQVDIHPDTVVGYWPFGTQPGHCIDVGAEKYDVLVSSRPKSMEGVMRAWFHDHTPTTVGFMLYPGNAQMRPSEAPTPLEDLFNYKSMHRTGGPLSIQGQLCITKWFCEQLVSALGAMMSPRRQGGENFVDKIDKPNSSSGVQL
jgi:hypothetical protein